MSSAIIFHLAWLIPLIPLLVFVAIALFAWRGRALGRPLALGGIAIATVLALFAFLAEMLMLLEGEQGFAATLIGGWCPIRVHIDPLSALMLAAVALACTIVFIYSLSAVGEDIDRNRLYAFLSLLAAGALGLFIFDNLLLVFACWEVMDVCAYLLTGLRHERSSARQAALKVFLTTKAGDLFLLLGTALLYGETGSLSFGAETLGALAGLGHLDPQVVAVIAALFLAGVMVKGGQFPFHTWLPEATEAPAPASALIHVTATSAAAFLLLRIFPLLEAAGGLSIPGLGLSGVTLVGVVTAVLATLFAVTQRDVRRALSFFAIGQLGHVFVALGMGAVTAGVFHLVAGIFFNTLLFLAAGSVTQGMASGRAGEQVDPNDMFNMGGLGERQPLTFLLFLVGGAALAGSPLITGAFWSRDAILAQAWANQRTLFWVLALIAAVTAFGVMRQLVLIFAGMPRSRTAQRVIESRSSITLPLIFLALIVAVMGWAGTPTDFPIGLGVNLFETFLGAGDVTHEFVWEPVALCLWSGLGAVSLLVGFIVYAWWPVQVGEADRVGSAMRAMWLGWLYDLLRNALHVGGLYQWAFKGLVWLGRALVVGDGVLDELVIAAIRSMGGGLAALGDWVDTHVLTPAFGSISRVAGPVARIADRVDAWLGVPAGLVSEVGEVLARPAGIFDTGLDRLVILAKPGTLALMQLSVVVDRGLNVVVSAVGRAVRAAGLCFRLRTGRVQSYLRMASIAVLVLMAMFFVFLFVHI